MTVYFTNPELTVLSNPDAKNFFEYCKSIFEHYETNIKYINSDVQLNTILSGDIDKHDILIFFNSIDGVYSDTIFKLVKMFYRRECRIWPIAITNNPECRRPPEPAVEKQSFDVFNLKENRHSHNSIVAIAQIFTRKIIAQTLSPLYRDEVLYFISHKRSDGEHIAGKLADSLKLLTRERNVYRDVVNVAVGDYAQKDIDIHLLQSDVVIFLQTKEAHNSDYIMKELCCALVNDIPVLWIQIDGAPSNQMPIKPGDEPILSYYSTDFDSENKLERIIDEIEEKCFQLIMNSSNQVFSYVQYLNEMNSSNMISLQNDSESILAYSLKYNEKTRDRYSNGEHSHYIQCYGRNPQKQDFENFKNRVNSKLSNEYFEKFLLLSNHGKISKEQSNSKFGEENYEDYITNIENVVGVDREKRNKKIIISGAFSDNDEIYKASLIEALLVYSKEIVKRGYTLVFGAHPTFQKPIFEIGALYSDDVKYAIEMHMDEIYLKFYEKNELNDKCTLVLSNGLSQMRERMISQDDCILLICLGGKIKENKLEQGVDIEVAIAQKFNIPVALVGTVGGRSSEYASEVLVSGQWSKLNGFSIKLNEELYYNVNHRLMAKKLLDSLEKSN